MLILPCFQVQNISQLYVTKKTSIALGCHNTQIVNEAIIITI